LRFQIVVLGAILPNLFPGWVTGSATAITYTFGINEDLYRYIAVGLLVTIGLLSLIALSVLAFSTLSIQENVGTDLAFIQVEGNILADVIAPWFATFFFAAASIKLFSTNLGILDWVSRLTADSLKVSFLGESQFCSESKIYLTVVWTMITVGSVIILTGIEPVVLLTIASSGGGS
jgi:hypothetical protein